jgi:hypothetical protein
MGAAETGNKKSLYLDAKVFLTMLVDEFNKLNQKLESIVEVDGKILKMQEEFLQKIANQNYPKEAIKPEPDVMTLLSLPSALRKTVMALYKLKEATAEDLSRETKRLRAVESASANQLVRMGFLSKKREGRNVYFYIE